MKNIPSPACSGDSIDAGTRTIRGFGATLTIEPLPNARPGDRVVTVDCACGTTVLTVLPGREPLRDAYVVAIALDKHHREQPGCRHIKYLAHRYDLWGRGL